MSTTVTQINELRRAFERAHDEWAWFYGMARELGGCSDPMWRGIESHLANRADGAFADLEEYIRRSENDQ